MRTRSDDRVELRAPTGRKAKWARAAERAGVSLSDWIRRRLDRDADEELADEESGAPSPADIRASLSSRGALRGSGFGARVRRARGPWTV